MKVTEIPLSQLHEALWNPNRMDTATRQKLKSSLSRYGLVEPLVIRPLDGAYEVISGNHRLQVIQSTGATQVPCVVLDLNDNEAMLLAQALNGLRGEEDLALKGQLLKKVLAVIPQSEVLDLLPETADSLQTLATIGEADLAEHLQAWEQAQQARLKHMQLQFTPQQLDTVETALDLILPEVKEADYGNPNTRGNAIYLLCRFFLERRDAA